MSLQIADGPHQKNKQITEDQGVQIKSYRIECITWRDASSEDPWVAAENIDSRSSEIFSVGIFIQENEDVITLALNHDTDSDSYSCIMHIPKSIVTQRIIIFDESRRG